MGARLRRDNLRRTWVPTGKDLKRLEEERGVVRKGSMLRNLLHALRFLLLRLFSDVHIDAQRKAL